MIAAHVYVCIVCMYIHTIQYIHVMYMYSTVQYST